MIDHRHIFLYAKNHYATGDMISDLKIIIGHRAGIDPDHISIGDIYDIMISLFLKYTSTIQKEELLL